MLLHVHWAIWVRQRPRARQYKHSFACTAPRGSILTVQAYEALSKIDPERVSSKEGNRRAISRRSAKADTRKESHGHRYRPFRIRTLGEGRTPRPCCARDRRPGQRRAGRAALHAGAACASSTGGGPRLSGQYPFMRGVHASMYRSRLWTMRQFAGFGSARQTNRPLPLPARQGQTGLSTAFDLPTLMVSDSDDPRSRSGEVGAARRRCRYARRHGDGFSTASTLASFRVDDHLRPHARRT